MTKPVLRKIKPLTILLLILTSTIITISFLPKAKAETKILSIEPSSGNVGTTVQLRANISTVNGTYEIWFDETFLTSRNATGNDVNASFTGPYAPAGSHNVTIIDVDAGENDTITFTVLTSYSLKIDVPEPPKQLQEGDPMPISVNITGGESGKTYVANITVQAPSNASYTQLLNVTLSDVGSGNETITYPEDFPTGANANFTGEYEIFFNSTLATETFFMGLTNSTEYHRFQVVDVEAVYKPNENVTLAITCEDVHHSANLTASATGIVHYTNWTVPSNASIGTCTVSVTSISNITKKEPPDIQNFTVLGFAVNITVRNLAGEPVPNVNARVFEEGRTVENGTSGSDGLVHPELPPLMLEIGNYTCEAYFRDKKVGERWINITEASSWDFYCNITNLKIVVIDEAEIRIPEVKLYLTPENQTLKTDINGTRVFHSLLPNIPYTLNASRYDTLFNTTTIQLPTTAWFNITIICPTMTLQVNATDANGQPINNATVKVQEVMGGLFHEGNTVDGVVSFNCALGRYDVTVYVNDIKLNKTTVDLFQNRNVSIHCSYYGLTVSVRVVDYFGQPIPNVNVTFPVRARSLLTDSSGIATFNNIIGGSMQITVYLASQTQPCTVKTPHVDESKTIEIKIAKYVILAGFLVETSQLATAIIILATVILILLIEIYRKRHLKPQKGSS